MNSFFIDLKMKYFIVLEIIEFSEKSDIYIDRKNG